MFFILMLSMLMLGCIDGRDALFIAAGLFAIASSIEQAVYRLLGK